MLVDLLRQLLGIADDGGPIEDSEAAAAEKDLRAAIHAAYIEVHKQKIDRAFRAADFVTRAAGAIGTIYTGLLALVYSVEGKTPRPLPARGIAPAVFLALAFFFSVVNVGFVRKSSRRVDILPEAVTWKDQQVRLVRFMQWIDRGALQRAWALRVSIICLGAGVALLPLPFVAFSKTQTTVAISIATGVVVAWLLREAVASWHAKRQSGPARAPAAGTQTQPQG